MADNSSCHYDCSQPLDQLSPYSDISGLGVLVGYTATAGIVVIILVCHYHIAHDPTKDPFDKNSTPGAATARNPRPNPIDVVYLGLVSKILAAWRRLHPNLPKAKAYPRLEVVFIECVQSMSDLQILTGTSILISGYVQLHCGLSAFHWQIIVYLAWFSSITHLSCLTFLRNHLYNRPAERNWRLVAMGLMLIMLLVAMIPTGGYNWTEGYYGSDAPIVPAPSDYAICYWQPTGNDDQLNFSTMVISVLLLALGFMQRVVRLHKSLSVSVLGVFRTFCSERARNFLRRTYTTMGMETSGLTLKRLFLWRPLLALFLTARALLDLWNSMFIEILWMIGSFIWGLIRLLQALPIEDRGSNDWSFGQVIPLVLLAAPLLTIFESFFKEQPTNTLSTALVQFHNAFSQAAHNNAMSITPLQARDHPDQNFYRDSRWTNTLIYLMVASATGIMGDALALTGSANTKLILLLIPTPVFPSYLPFYIAFAVWEFITFSLLLEDISYAKWTVPTHWNLPAHWNAPRISTKRFFKGLIDYCGLVFIFLTLTGALLSILDDSQIPAYYVCAGVGIYGATSIMFSRIAVRHVNLFS